MVRADTTAIFIFHKYYRKNGGKDGEVYSKIMILN